MHRPNPFKIASSTAIPQETWIGRNLVVAAGALLLIAFFAVPVSLATKSHAFLHGLCAQTPSHSYVVGGNTVPFDARMTGIYLGFLIGFAMLVQSGRHRSAGLPTISSGLILLALAGAMALDGFNSLLTDIGRYALYEPDNRYRLLTGFGAGIGLATVMAMLIGMSLWRKPDSGDHVLKRWWEPLLFCAPVLPLLLFFQNAPSWTYPLVVSVLIISAVTVFSGLATVSAVLLLRRENTFDASWQLQRLALAGLTVGILTIAALAGVRFVLESLSNAPALT